MNIKDIIYIEKAHQKHPKQPKDSVRFWDEKTPYYIHPLWCALTISTETSLDERTRGEGKQVLLYHDILEDTTVDLPEWLSNRVKWLIGEMTFKHGMQQEIIEVWDRPSEVRLYKLYDKISNLMDAIWMGAEKKQNYEQYTKRLLENIREVYGELNITKIAKGILS